MSSNNKEFAISNWAIDNNVTVYILTFIIIMTGIYAYITMPREDFPEIIESKIFVSSVYPGNSVEDVEKLITKPLEKKLKSISGVEKITSNSFQDYSLITVEFHEKVGVDLAKQRVKDEVDNAKADQDWPNLDNGGKVEPNVFNINISEEVPILNVNFKGDYQSQKLKDYAKIVKDEVELIPEIKKADIAGVGDKEVEVAIDLFKMSSSKTSFDDIARAIQGENATITAGTINTSGKESNIRIIGEFQNYNDIGNIVVKNMGGVVYLKDIADVQFQEKERTTYARESGKDVVMLTIKKRSGTNMIDAIEKIKKRIEELQESKLPKDLSIEYTGDQSHRVEHAVDELSNHIIFGIVLVMLVLMFNMGLKNSIFVGSAIPLSMLMAFSFLSSYGVTLNTMVLFALVMGLGMLVDDGIVVVDNVYANMQKGMDRIQASKVGIGEIAWPVISSTATTLAAFFPLGLWPGTMGKFMVIFPATLSVVLGASLFVALVINATMTGHFMTLDENNLSEKAFKRNSVILAITALVTLIAGYMMPNAFFRAIGHISLIAIFLMWFYKNYLYRWTQNFQHSFFPAFEKKYASYLSKVLVGKTPYYYFAGIIGLFILSILLMVIFPRKVLFFPDNMPNQNIIYIEYPQGTPIEKTNETTKKVEKEVFAILDKYRKKDTSDPHFLVQSVVSLVGKGAGNPQTDIGNSSELPYKGKITVLYQEFNKRKGISTQKILEDLQHNVHQIPGAKLTIEKEHNGPPRGYPISIDLEGEDYDKMMTECNKMIEFLEKKNIPGIEELNIDVNKEKPELKMYIDRLLAGSLGASTGMIGFNLRRAIYGQDVSTYKENDEDYDIAIRLRKDQRESESVILNQPITFRNQANGQIYQISLSTLSNSTPSYTFNQIKHRQTRRTMTIYSNVLEGYNANDINSQIRDILTSYKLPEGMNFTFTGEQEEQAKNMNFLLKALLIALFGVATIIVLQFNSTSKTLIIMATILLSFSGVFFGLVIFNRDFIILMTMMGIISLTGVVVKNGIVLIDFFVLLLDKKIKERGVPTHEDLSMDDVKDVIIESGRSRLRPVLLTATTAILGLIPLAIGLNFNFFTFFTDLNPHLYLGGDNVKFWGPLAWTIIYGLTYATILTLVMVPVMFIMASRIKHNKRMKELEAQKTIKA